jgi:protein-L-isoaspartate(D-aspartate) O-methyltransferase
MTDVPRRRSKFPLQLNAVRTPPAPGAPTAPATVAPTPAPPEAGAAPRAVLRPQQPVAQAHRDAARRPGPTGPGMDSAALRAQMVQRLRAAGLRSEVVLRVLGAVPRHTYVDAALVGQAYEDTSLPIGHGQTISKPSVVGRMIELLLQGHNAQRLHGLGSVLEIGTGCGYQAAVLARLGRLVISVERLRALHDTARERLAPTRTDNLRLVYADGMFGHPPNAPYDSIIAAAGGDDVPAAWVEQLAVGGRLVSPVRGRATTGQILLVVDRTEVGYTRSEFEAVHFVPLKSGLGA